MNRTILDDVAALPQHQQSKFWADFNAVQLEYARLGVLGALAMLSKPQQPPQPACASEKSNGQSQDVNAPDSEPRALGAQGVPRGDS